MTDDAPAPADPTRSPDPASPAAGISARTAAVLVFCTSAAVLIVELVALRLLAPFLGLTLETNTLVIGIVLAAIAVGSWVGGGLADRTDPRRALAPLLAVSGVVVALIPTAVRGLGAANLGELVLLTTGIAIFVPGALLSAISPMVAKMRLTTLEETGSVVGHLSGIGTVGSIFGTVLTGFVLISRVPVAVILLSLGGLLVLSALGLGLRDRGWRGAVTPVVLVAAGAGAAAIIPAECEVETTYHCARVVEDPERPSGRTLVLDSLRHSYVDLQDPTHLEFDYIKAAASVTDAALPEGEAVSAYHLGAGGLTLPRYLARVRPGTTGVVSEIDPGVVRIDRERLAADDVDGLEIRVEDGRLGVGRIATGSRDLVVGDAFGGVSVPWHLTTTEAMTEVRRTLDEDGLYVANLIDHGPMDFARAELATLAEVFPHTVALLERADLDGTDDGGNLVAVASNRPVDAAAIQAVLDDRELEWTVLEDEALADWVGDATVLTDDFAPVDQLLTPYRTAAAARP